MPVYEYSMIDTWMEMEVLVSNMGMRAIAGSWWGAP